MNGASHGVAYVCTFCRQALLPPEQLVGFLQHSCCPDCGEGLRMQKHSKVRVSKEMAFVLSAASLLLMLHAYTQPILSLREASSVREASLIFGIFQVYTEGKVFLAFFMLLFSLVAPLVKNAMILLSSAGLGFYPRWERRAALVSKFMSPWAGLEVVMFGISLILFNFGSDIVAISEGPALVSYLAMAVTTIAASWFYSA